MKKTKTMYFPIASADSSINDEKDTLEDVIGDSPCPCCGNLTIPNKGDALAYICPVCFWEIDLFILSEDEPSDQNHGLTLTEARKNYALYGACLPSLKQYCRPPRKRELL